MNPNDENANSNLEIKQVEQNNKYNVKTKTKNQTGNSIAYLKSNKKFKPNHTGHCEVIEKCNSFKNLIRFAGDVHAKPYDRQFIVLTDLYVPPKEKVICKILPLV